MIRIEVLYPEIANLYGDLANVRYLSGSVQECEVAENDLWSRPLFLDADNKIDIVYMGTMSERSQLIAMEHIEPYADEVRTAIDRGQHFLFTGNAFEIFAKEIIDTDDLPYEGDIPGGRVDSATKRTKCLGLFDITIKRGIMHRFNSLYLGDYDGLAVTGFKSIFAHAECNEHYEPLFETVRGPGFDNGKTGEGIRVNNFMATYLTGPLLVINPLLTVKLLSELGVDEEDIKPPFMADAMAAYEKRLSEFRDSKVNFDY